jgi:hypothetical protein
MKQLDKSEIEADGMLIGGKENTNYICLKMGKMVALYRLL